MRKFKSGSKKKKCLGFLLSAICCTSVALSCFAGCNFVEDLLAQLGMGNNQSQTDKGNNDNDKEPGNNDKPQTGDDDQSQTGGNEQGGDKEQGNKPGGDEEQGTTPKPPIAEDRFTAEQDKIAVFANGEPHWSFHKAKNWSNGGMFNCIWRESNVNFYDGAMNISITTDSEYGYAGGEYRTNNNYSFGYYSVSMKPAKCAGTVSSFFTYTNTPRWDEIDIEFLGKDTTKVQFNYYTDGVGEHEYLFDLGFDASLDYHEYGFYWQTDCIIWYVDGKAVYKATTDIPQYAGKIMTNVWNGIGVDEWLGAFDSSKLPVTAKYKWIGYKGS